MESIDDFRLEVSSADVSTAHIVDEIHLADGAPCVDIGREDALGGFGKMHKGGVAGNEAHAGRADVLSIFSLHDAELQVAE